MRIDHRYFLPTALLAAGALTLGAAQLASAAAQPAPAATRAVPVRGERLVTLPTGDQVRLVSTSKTKPVALVKPAATHGPEAALTTRTLGADTYVFPVIAEPYLGQVLDPALFDVTKLGAAARRDGRVQLRLSYSGATPSVPGVTITSASAGSAKGYVTAASAASFRSALAKQWKADAAAGWPKHTTLFGASRITADVPGSTVVTPTFPMITLIVKAIGPDGKPLADSFGLVANVDDASKYVGFVDIIDGEARISVPKGNYAAVFDDFTFDEDTGAATDYIVPTVTYAVKGAGQTLTIDFRKATASPSLKTPKPATTVSYSYAWTREDEAGHGGIGSVSVFAGGDTIKIAPTPVTTLGTQTSTFGWSLVGPGTPPAYSYDLGATSNHVAAKLAFTFTQQGLATTKDRFFTDGPKRNGSFIRYPLFPDSGGGGIFWPWTMPATRIGYVGALGGTPEWAAELNANDQSPDDPGWTFDAPVTIPKGTTRTEDWLRGPIEAGIPYQPSYPFCYACRTSTQMSIGLAGVTDSTRDHVGVVFGAADGIPVARFRLYQDGDLIFDQDDYLGVDAIDVPARAATYRAVLDLDRRLTLSTQSTRTQTELTFRSASGQGPATGPDWFCTVDAGNGCRVLPVLQAKLALPTSLNGRLPAGVSAITVTAGRIQGAAASTVTSAGLEIRRPGSDWETVKLTASGGGKFTGKIDNSDSAGASIDVRISASDAGGSTFKETVLKAYTVGGA